MLFELRVIDGEGEGNRVLARNLVTIGRAWTNELVLASAPKVSGRHGKIEEREGELWYRDLGSRNGSRIERADGSVVDCDSGGEAVKLAIGDRLLLGGNEDPVRVAVLEPSEEGRSWTQLQTTLASDLPLVGLARLSAGPRAGSFTRFLVEMVSEMRPEQAVEALADLVAESFPGWRSIFVYLQGQEPALARGKGAGPGDEPGPELIHQTRDLSEVVVFESESGPGFAVPLRSSTRTVGALVVSFDAARSAPGEEELQFAGTYAHYAGRIIEEALDRSQDRERIVQLQDLSEGLQRQLRELDPELDIVGNDRGIAEALQRAKQVATFPTPVLVTGPTGTGKELVARAIHRFSDRRDAPFLAINCGALPENLLESELFGHVKGSFSSAHRDRAGLFETAHGGTLFFDEVGEMPLPLQVKLLRVLQEGELYRVGSSRSVKVDVRVIAATHRDLDEAVRDGSFREDLLYRLNVFPIRLPALKDRPGDIGVLAVHFARRIAQRFGKEGIELSGAAVESLASEDWPGNVRELQNRIERAVILCGGTRIEAEHVGAPSRPGGSEGFLSLAQARERFVVEHVRRALALSDGVQKEAARLLGLDPGNLSRLMKELGLR
jgi:transcriptional regulator with GAF, ATPase, and Fis domain/pSer/pThr/pTyr-binding forkhead associated (FHA) protein